MNPPMKKVQEKSAIERGVGGPRWSLSLGVAMEVGVGGVGAGTAEVRVVGYRERTDELAGIAWSGID